MPKQKETAWYEDSEFCRSVLKAAQIDVSRNHERLMLVNAPRCHPGISAGGLAALVAIGRGMRLRVPFDCQEPTLVEGLRGNRPAIPVSVATAQEILAIPSYRGLRRMERETETYAGGARIGWLESGLDGEQADFYSMAM